MVDQIRTAAVTRLRDAWRSLSVAQAIVLVAIVVVTGWLVAHAPPDLWSSLAEKDPAELGGRIALFVLAIVGVFLRHRSSETYEQGPTDPDEPDDEPTRPSAPRALDRQQRPPGDRGGAA